MAETGTETPEVASEVKNTRRAKSALSKLSAEQQAQIIKDALDNPEVSKAMAAASQTPHGSSEATASGRTRASISTGTAMSLLMIPPQ